ncbi:MAG TPA: hypothetical protein VMA75_02870 [Candidatus Paceibacterota bacterium]|nr:hypothetical protein [Candidatus Paceibacterota bacterium]
MNRKTELGIFFASLIVIGGAIAGGLFYIKAQKNTANPVPPSVSAVASSSASAPSLPENPQQNVETIPTSTVIISVPSSVKAAASLPLPYSFGPATATSTYWPKAWGALSYENNMLTLIPDPATHGANSFLAGASSWTNYAVNADASPLEGGWFDIVARVSNNQQDFVYCEFGPNGTEVIERVNTADTQIAYAAASTTAAQGASENFGMEVYGNDIGCMMNGHEAVATHVAANESPVGGIGFVTFGQPASQKGVAVSEVSVMPLSNETISVPFPVATPSQAAAQSAAPASNPTPAPPAASIIPLPYSTSTFSAADWGSGWGVFSTTGGALNLGTDITGTSAGIFLNGSGGWINYTYTAYVGWVSGQTFDLVARRMDGGNLLECIFSDVDAADTNVSINMIQNGQTIQLSPGETLTTSAAHMFGIGFPVSMTVNGANVQCGVDNQTISAVMNGDVLPRGGIGFITWDPQAGNSQIRVTKITATAL